MNRLSVVCIGLSFMAVAGALWINPVTAETLVLKSGKVVEGDMISMTAQEITLEIFGVPVNYALQDVESIDGAQVSVPPALSPQQKKPEVLVAPIEPQQLSTEQILPEAQTPEISVEPPKVTATPVLPVVKEPENQQSAVSRDDAAKARDYFQIGLIHSTLNENDKAKENYRKALKLDPGIANYYLEEALNYHYLGKEADARENFRQARELYEAAEDFRGAQLVNEYLKDLYTPTAEEEELFLLY